MGAPQDAPLPPDIDLDGGATIQVTALDPATGALVAGVILSDVYLRVIDTSGAGAAAFESGPFMLVPGPNA